MDTKRIDRIAANFDQIVEALPEIMRPQLNMRAVSAGLNVSKLSTQQPNEVAMSPYMKNMLHAKGMPHGTRLRPEDPLAAGEIELRNRIEAGLKHYNGEKLTVYNESLPLDDKSHYDVDCWVNFKDNLRQIVPGMLEQRKENIEVFTERTDWKKVRDKLQSDDLFRKCVDVICDVLPSVAASDKFIEINNPFESKYTNVGYPFYKNGRLAVNEEHLALAEEIAPGSVGRAKLDLSSKKAHNKTITREDINYNELTLAIAERITKPQLLQMNMAAAYGKNKNGKGRLIIGTSRIISTYLNRLEAVEIATYKEKCSLYTGYKDDSGLKQAMTEMLKFCETEGLKARNVDQSGYDFHVNMGFIILAGAIAMEKSLGDETREIALLRALLGTHSWIIDGMGGQIKEIWGHIFSGFIDTNRGGGLINAIAVLYTMMKQDPHYSAYWYMSQWVMFVMGDDNLFVYKDLDYDRFKADLKDLGFDVNADKDTFGIFFLQNRLYKNTEAGQLVMTYPWTRVVRSIFYKDSAKGLGPVAWNLATWSQLWKLNQDFGALCEALKIVINADNERLMLDCDVNELRAKLQSEMEEAIQKMSQSTHQKSAAKREAGLTFAEKLYDGDPTKAAMFTINAEGQLDLKDDFLTNMQKLLRKAAAIPYVAAGYP